MTKAIWVLIIAVVLFGGWKLFEYWDRIQNEKASAAKEAAAKIVSGNQLPGMPRWEWEQSLEAAQRGGSDSLGSWLKLYGHEVRDPRKAWIELDYVILLGKKNPQEAKRLFTEVKRRTPENSPVRPRIRELEKSYE